MNRHSMYMFFVLLAALSLFWASLGMFVESLVRWELGSPEATGSTSLNAIALAILANAEAIRDRS